MNVLEDKAVRREVQMLRALRHASIAAEYGAYKTSNEYIIVMQW